MERKAYVILTDTGTIFTKMIKMYTKKPLNHASISFDDQLKIVYSFGRKKPWNPFIGGFVRENIRDGLFKNARCAIYCCTVTEKQYELMKNKVKTMEENKDHYKYNLLGLLAIMVNKKIERKNAYFCSQFVASILEESGIPSVNQKPLSLVTPHDIHGTYSLRLVYEGKLSYYLIKKKIDKRLNQLKYLKKII